MRSPSKTKSTSSAPSPRQPPASGGSNVSVPTLLITGPGGVGKTTVAFEVCHRLEAADIAHAMIDTDELDRIYPPPADDPHKRRLTSKNLAAVWENLRAAGAPRLVLTMVALHLEEELPFIQTAVPEAEISVVRLLASEDVLLERVRSREPGSWVEKQSRRSLETLRLMVQESAAGQLVVETTGCSVSEVAGEVLQRAGWPG